MPAKVRPVKPDFGGLPGSVHNGFWKSLVKPLASVHQPAANSRPTPSAGEGLPFAEAMYEEIKSFGGARKKLWITGHSLGGAHAQLLAMYLAAHEGPMVAQGVYAIASPHVGTKKFVAHMDNVFAGNRLQRFEFLHDTVTKVPGKITYKRAGCRVYYPNLVSAAVFDAPERKLGESILGVRLSSNFTYHYPHWYLKAAHRELGGPDQERAPSPLTLPTVKGDVYENAKLRRIAEAWGLL